MLRKLKSILVGLGKSVGLMSLYHLTLAFFGKLLAGNPSKKLVVIGVTGTKGKSTVLELVNAGLERAGKKTLLASSVRIKVGDNTHVNSTGNTMPGRGFLQGLMKKGVSAGCEYALLEVVSEGVVQHRHRFIEFDMAGFLNIHPEHIESHGSFEKYRDAKVKFFKDVDKKNGGKKAKFFVNQDDGNANHFIQAVDEESVVLTTRRAKELKMRGDFNKENAGLAEAILRDQGISEEIIVETFKNFEGVPGRMEFVREKPFSVVVDYAHTPDSLEAVYRSLKPVTTGGLICVLGSAGGGRDKWKRPEMAKIAAAHCREIFLTDEDPFDEDPEKILEDMLEGIPTDSKKKVHQSPDRRNAIESALGSAQNGDTVIITGKGSEPYIRRAKGEKIPWSDVGVVNEVLG